MQSPSEGPRNRSFKLRNGVEFIPATAIHLSLRRATLVAGVATKCRMMAGSTGLSASQTAESNRIPISAGTQRAPVSQYEDPAERVPGHSDQKGHGVCAPTVYFCGFRIEQSQQHFGRNWVTSVVVVSSILFSANTALFCGSPTFLTGSVKRGLAHCRKLSSFQSLPRRGNVPVPLWRRDQLVIRKWDRHDQIDVATPFHENISDRSQSPSLRSL